MARRRVHVPSGDRTFKVAAIELQNPAALVTLEDPDAPLPHLDGVFARLRPPADTEPMRVDEWRDIVLRAGARAVRIVATPRSAAVPVSLDRSSEFANVGTFREEALALAEETGENAVVDFVRRVLDEVGA